MRKLGARYVYTLAGEPIRNGVVVTENSGRVLDVVKESEAGDFERYEGIIAPGFINAHCHLELSHLRNRLTPSGGLINFILGVQSVRTAPLEFIAAAMADAHEEMAIEGVVAVGDVSNTDSSFLLKACSPLTFHTFIEAFSFLPDRAPMALENALGLKKQYQNLFKEKDSRVSLTPHAPYSVSKDLFKLINSAEKGIKSIHSQESAMEDLFFQTGNGPFRRLYEELSININFFKGHRITPLQAYSKWLFGKKLLIHNTYARRSDFNLENIDALNFSFCICPKANLFIEGELPNLNMLVSTDLPILIGTDSLASNDRLSMIDEMRTIQEAYPQISLQTLLTWACKNGAAFFGWGNLGTIERGKKPGLVLIQNLSENLTLTVDSNSNQII